MPYHLDLSIYVHMDTLTCILPDHSIGWSNEGEELWEYLMEVAPTLPLKGFHVFSHRVDDCGERKDWLKENLSEVMYKDSLIFSEDNVHTKANALSILIDGHKGTVEKWREHRGLAVHHKTPQETIEELTDFGICVERY